MGICSPSLLGSQGMQSLYSPEIEKLQGQSEPHIWVTGKGWAVLDPDWLPCPLTTPFCDPRLCGTQWKTAQPGWLLPPLQESPLPDLAFLSLLVPSSDVGLTLSILGPLTPDHVVTEGTFFPGSGPSLGSPVEFGIDYCVCMCVHRRE